MRPSNQPPLEAIVLPDLPPRRQRRIGPVIVGSFFVLAALGGMGIGVWSLVQIVEGEQGGQPTAGVGKGNDQWPTPEERRSKLVATYVPRPPEIQDAELRGVERLLTQVTAASQKGNDAAFRKLVDFERFMQRMRNSSTIPSMTSSDWRDVRKLVERESDMPHGITAARLVGLTRTPRADELIAEVWLNYGNQAGEPCRFYLNRGARAWRIFDWELVEYGRSEVEKWAAAQQTRNDFRELAYGRMLEDLTKCDECWARQDAEGAHQALRDAESRSIPPCVRQTMWFSIGRRWNMLGEAEQVLRACDQVLPPEDVPGVFVLRAHAHTQLQQPAKVVEAVMAYERVAGFSPEMAQLKGEAHIELRMQAEAKAEFRRLLDFEPETYQVLHRYRRMLQDEEKPELVSLAGRAKDPAQAALNMLTSCLYDMDDAGVQCLKAWLEAKYANTSAIHVLAGHLAEHEGKYGPAADSFLLAYRAETNDEHKAQWRQNYLSAMTSAGKTVEAYEELGDYQATFESLTAGIDEGEGELSWDDFPKLAAAHRKRFPDDPWLHYYLGIMARDNGDLKRARDAFATAEAKTEDEYLRDMARYERAAALTRMGKVVEAYQAGKTPGSDFQQLAGICRSEADAKSLDALIRTHREREANDPWILYYEAVAAHLRQESNKALDLIRSAEGKSDAAEDESLAGTLTGLLIEILEKHEGWVTILEQREDIETLAPLLASRFRSAGKWDKLRMLLEVMQRRGGENRKLLSYQADLAWHLRDYDALCQLIPIWDKKGMEKVPEYAQSMLREKLVRAHLRLGRLASALAFADQFQREYHEQFPLLLTHVAFGNVEDVRRLLIDEQLLARGYPAIEPATDVELYPLLTDPRFAQLRRETAFPLPDTGSGRRGISTVVLFFAEPRAWDEQRLAEAIRRLGAKVPAITPLKMENSRTGIQGWHIPLDTGTCLITVGEGNYFDCELIAAYAPQNESLARMLYEQGGWLTLDWIPTPHANRPGDDVVPILMAGALATEGIVGLGVWTPDLGPTHLLADESIVPTRLLRAANWEQVFQGLPAETTWLSLDAEHSVEEPEDEQDWSRHRRAIRRFAVGQTKQGENSRAEVLVNIAAGSVNLQEWMPVTQVERQEYGDFQFICRLTKDSPLWPHLTAGTLWRVSEHEVLKWRESPESPPQQ